MVNLEIRTLQRWRQAGNIKEDQRPLVVRAAPKNKLSPEERAHIISVCNQPRFAQLPPSQIVPLLADEGVYIASESTMYRVLREASLLHHRGRSLSPKAVKAPTTHTATGIHQVWTWDISYLPCTVKGLYHYLYLILDIYSRKIVGWEVYECESGDYASHLIARAVLVEKITHKPLILHSDNGAPMKSQTFLAKLDELGITSSRSRPRVSNDNPYSEAMFKTLKYCPKWPIQGFATLEDARVWVKGFVYSYNEEHRHSQIQFVTPAQRHRGEDQAILAKRHAVYEAAKAKNTARWSGDTRNWKPVGNVSLNPEKTEQKKSG